MRHARLFVANTNICRTPTSKWYVCIECRRTPSKVMMRKRRMTKKKIIRTNTIRTTKTAVVDILTFLRSRLVCPMDDVPRLS